MAAKKGEALQRELKSHSGRVNSAAFSPDGQRLYVSGYSGPSGPADDRNLGATYEIKGPWFVPASSVGR